MRLAHKFAIESDYITADMVEAIEFPHLANKYTVYGVPRTVINETVHQEGAVPEPMMLAKLLEAVGKEAPPPPHARGHEEHAHEHASGDQDLDEEDWDDEEEWEEEDWDDDEEWDDDDEEFDDDQDDDDED